MLIIDALTSPVSIPNKVEWVDTHAHLNFATFENDLGAVINRTLRDNIWIINVGTNYRTSKRAVEIAQKYGI